MLSTVKNDNTLLQQVPIKEIILENVFQQMDHKTAPTWQIAVLLCKTNLFFLMHLIYLLCAVDISMLLNLYVCLFVSELHLFRRHSRK